MMMNESVSAMEYMEPYECDILPTRLNLPVKSQTSIVLWVPLYSLSCNVHQTEIYIFRNAYTIFDQYIYGRHVLAIAAISVSTHLVFVDGQRANPMM